MLSTVWTPQRGSWSYTEKRRRRKETEVTGRRKEGFKRREIQPVISSLSVLHSPEHTKRFTELGREEKGEVDIEVTWWRKRRVKRGREPSSQ